MVGDDFAIIELRSRKIVFITAFRSFLVAALLVSMLAGCANNGSSKTSRGAATGAVVGAGIGLLIGVLAGDSRVAAAGVAVGAGVGAGQGAYEGWVQEPGQERLNVRARVNADIQMSYFVELAYIDLEVTGVDSQVWGTSTIGYDKDDGYNISTRFNTLPEPLRTTAGSWNQPSRSFNFKGSGYRLIVRFDTPDRFTVETFITTGCSEQQIESFKFTRS